MKTAKQHLQRAILFLLPFVVFYAFGSFVAADFNSTHWPQDARFAIGLASLVVGGLLVFAHYDFEWGKE